MTLEEFAQVLDRLADGQEPAIPYNLHGGIRRMQNSSPDTTSANRYGWGHAAWALFFRDLAAAEYPEEATS